MNLGSFADLVAAKEAFFKGAVRQAGAAAPEEPKTPELRHTVPNLSTYWSWLESWRVNAKTLVLDCLRDAWGRTSALQETEASTGLMELN